MRSPMYVKLEAAHAAMSVRGVIVLAATMKRSGTKRPTAIGVELIVSWAAEVPSAASTDAKVESCSCRLKAPTSSYEAVVVVTVPPLALQAPAVTVPVVAVHAVPAHALSTAVGV